RELRRSSSHRPTARPRGRSGPPAGSRRSGARPRSTPRIVPSSPPETGARRRRSCSRSFRSPLDKPRTPTISGSGATRKAVLSGRSGAESEHDVARLLAAFDVAGSLDDLVEWVPSVDHGPVLLRVDELLDEEEVLLAIPADAEPHTPTSDKPRDEGCQWHVVHEAEVGGEIDAAALEGAPTAAKRVLADGVEDHVVLLAVLGEVLPEAIENTLRAKRAQKLDVFRVADGRHVCLEVAHEQLDRT